jgi:hypothetical protein
MEVLSELDCRIYVDADQPPEELAALLARALAGATTRGPGSWTLRTRVGEVEIRQNKEADAGRACAFPDGFLYFRYALEYYPLPAVPLAERVALVAQVLEVLWSHGLPAVAACDYEGELPHGGGNKSSAVPWPSGHPRRPVAAP